MKDFKGKHVLITGGASGIGKIMGRLFLEKGAILIIWDINQTNIDKTVKEFSILGEIHGYKVDIADLVQIKSAATVVASTIGTVDVLINNAGIVVGKYFQDHTSTEVIQTMNINANAPMLVTLEFLPAMIKQNSGHVCNIASSAGLISNPRMSVYAASKWAVIGWSDSVRIEMERQKIEVGVTTVTPYYINTGMFDGVRSLIPILKPERVARKIVRAIGKNRIILSMPFSMHFIRFSQGLLPIWLFDWFTGSVLGIYKTMDHFTGRKE